MTWPTIQVLFRHDSAWNDYIAQCHGFTIRRGRQRLLGRTQPGICTLEMDNSAGTFDPGYNADCFVGQWVKLTSDSGSGATSLFSGTIRDVKVTWEDPGNSVAVIECIDALGLLAGITYDGTGTIPAGTPTGDAMEEILDVALEADGPWSGVSWLGGAGASGVSVTQLMSTATGTALDLIQKLEDGDGGYFFALATATDADPPQPAFHYVTPTTLYAATLYTYSDSATLSGSELPYRFAELEGGTSDDPVLNKATATISRGVTGDDEQFEGGTAQTYSDQTSIDTYLVRPWSESGLWLRDDAAALVRATQVVTNYKDPPSFEVRKLVLDPHTIDTAAAYRNAELLGLALGRRITIEKTPPYGSQKILECRVLGLTHEVRNTEGSREWFVTLDLEDASRWATTALILDEATLGKLDTGTLG